MISITFDELNCEDIQSRNKNKNKNTQHISGRYHVAREREKPNTPKLMELNLCELCGVQRTYQVNHQSIGP